MRLVLDAHKGVLNSAQKLLAKGAVEAVESVECQRLCFVRVADGRCFRSGGACLDDRRCFGIGRGDDSCY